MSSSKVMTLIVFFSLLFPLASSVWLPCARQKWCEPNCRWVCTIASSLPQSCSWTPRWPTLHSHWGKGCWPWIRSNHGQVLPDHWRSSAQANWWICGHCCEFQGMLVSSSYRKALRINLVYATSHSSADRHYFCFSWDQWTWAWTSVETFSPVLLLP